MAAPYWPAVAPRAAGKLFRKARPQAASSVAREQSVPPYVIFHDTTLRAMALARPQSIAEMADLPGVGEAKLDRYGAAFLVVIRATV